MFPCIDLCIAHHCTGLWLLLARCGKPARVYNLSLHCFGVGCYHWSLGWNSNSFAWHLSLYVLVFILQFVLVLVFKILYLHLKFEMLLLVNCRQQLHIPMFPFARLTGACPSLITKVTCLDTCR